MGVDTGLYMYDVVVKKFTFAISSPDEFLVSHSARISPNKRGVPQFNALAGGDPLRILP